jgi:hypothetical protein
MASRQPIFAALVALVVVTAGCATSGVHTPPQGDQIQVFEEESPTATLTPTPGSQESSTNVTFRNTSAQKLNEINQTIQSFSLNLVSNQSAKRVAARTANQTCTSFAPVNQSLFTDSSAVQSRSRMLSHAADVVNSHSEKQYVSPRRLRSVADKAGTIAKYTTMVGPWNQYYEASCSFMRPRPETVEDYYIATSGLLLELTLMQYQVYYKASFETIRVASHTRTFRLIQSKFGNQVLGLTQSVSHWTARGGLKSAPKVLREKAQKGNLSLASFNFAQVNTTLNGSLDRSGNISRNVSRMVSSCYEQVSNSEDEGSGGWIGKGEDFIEDGKDYAEDVISTGNVSDAVDDIEGVDAGDLSEDTIKSIQNCVHEKQNSSD